MRIFIHHLKFLAVIFWTGLISLASSAAESDTPITIDLTGNPSWAEFSASGIKVTETRGSLRGKLYYMPPAYVALKFPESVMVRCHMGGGMAHFEKNHLLYLEVQSEWMPLEEALVLGRSLHEALGLALNPLEKWAVEAGSKEPWRAKTFVFHAEGSGMKLQAEVKTGGGDTFPWIIRLVLTMPAANDKPSSTSPLFTKPGLISLDPPSGKRYTAEEDRRLSREKRGLPPITPARPSRTPNSVKAEETKPAAHQNQSGDAGAFLWLWIGAAIIGAVLVYGFLKRRKMQRLG